MPARVVAIVLLAVVTGLALWSDRPPAPVPASAPATEFSAGRALPIVDDLAREPHPVGSPAARRVRDDAVARLRALGLAPRVETGVVGGVAVANVVATLPGTAPTGTVVLAAHTDSVAAGPGAADDVASVAAILETVRALRAGPPLRDDVEVLLTDGEEAGLLGARAWVRDDLPRDRPTVVLNHEARGVAGPSLIFQTSPGNAGLVRAIAEAVPHPRGDSSLVAVYRLLPNDTDLSAVLAAGRPGVNSAFIERPSAYHTAGDTPAALSAASVQNQGSTMLALDPGSWGTPTCARSTRPRAGWLRSPTRCTSGSSAPSSPTRRPGSCRSRWRRSRRSSGRSCWAGVGVCSACGGVLAATGSAVVALVVAAGLGAGLAALAVARASGRRRRSGPTRRTWRPTRSRTSCWRCSSCWRGRAPPTPGRRVRDGGGCGDAARGARGGHRRRRPRGVVPARAPGAGPRPRPGRRGAPARAPDRRGRPPSPSGPSRRRPCCCPFASQVFLVDGVAHGLAVAAFAVALIPCAWSVQRAASPSPPGRLTRQLIMPISAHSACRKP